MFTIYQLPTGAHSQHGSFLSRQASNTSAVNPAMSSGVKNINENTSQHASIVSNIPIQPSVGI